ncbi:MAG: hypothetical protein AB9834_00220 [Lentimicrobium sp.]
MPLSFIKSSGNIITEDFCNALAGETKADYVKDKSFGPGMKKVDETIAVSFEMLRERWEEIRTPLLENKFDNATLRKRWILPLLEMLDFAPVFVASNIRSESGTDYHIPYKGWNSEYAPLIHLAHSSQDFDSKDKTNRTHPNKSPQDCLQQFLNTSHHQWAILTNGRKIRVLRDFYHSITKGFLEFDLEGIFETGDSEQFRVLFRILHRSRFENQYQGNQEIEYDDEGNPLETEDNCLLEKFHKKSRETGVKVGNKLRDQVRDAIENLGNGFAENLDPDTFQNGKVKEFYNEILNIIYRLLFLMFAEQKGWLPVRNNIYALTYSINALRERARRGNYQYDEEKDLWEGLLITFRLVANGYTFKNGDVINAFGGQLFSDRKIKTLLTLSLKNKYLLDAIYGLSYFKLDKLENRINYANLAIDELGSVYESLLDFEPKLAKEPTKIGNREIKRGEFYLDPRGTDRKTTGSYYTDSRLVAQLIESALVPVIHQALEKVETREEKEQALLNLKVADIACGSGAFLCAALEKLGEQLALIRMGDEERPTDEQLRGAKRDVLLNCIHGVDLNPMAIDLAKFSLWITASLPDMPLTFLDHKLKCGNSLIGATPELIEKGIPEAAYKPVGNDNPEICTKLRKKVKAQIERLNLAKEPKVQYGLTFAKADENDLLKLREKLNRHKQELSADVEEAEQEYRRIEKMERQFKEWLMADVWTAAFFIEKTEHDIDFYPTNTTLENLRENQPVKEELINRIIEISKIFHFFHFHLEFPEVFKQGGFDCLLGNPPWEKINFEDEEFFISRAPEIAFAKNKAERKCLIDKLPQTNSELFFEYISSKRWNDCLSIFFRESGAFPLTGVSRINLYSVFSEKYYKLKNQFGNAGIIVPPGIVAEDNNKALFNSLFSSGSIKSFVDFENKKGFFRDVHKEYRFSLLTLGSSIKNSSFFFFLTDIDQIFDEQRRIEMKAHDLEIINPNTLTLPLIKSKMDFKLIYKLHYGKPIIIDEKICNSSGWNISLKTPFNRSNDSGIFETKDKDGLLPLYESKMIYQYDDRYASIHDDEELVISDSSLKTNPLFKTKPFYYIPTKEIESRYGKRNWFLVYRMITNVNNSRTLIASVIPKAGCSNSLSIISCNTIIDEMLILANLNTFILDYVTRSKMNGRNLNHWIFMQLPIIAKLKISKKIIKIVSEIVYRLIYTSQTMRNIACELNFFDSPFIWNDKERFQLQCELDAIYAHLYGLEKEEMDYILETFPIVKRKDIAKYGTYRTKEAILKLYDEFSWVKDEMNET